MDASVVAPPVIASALAQHLRKDGRKGDSIVAHINPREAAMLLRAGGSGSRNPKDGLPEFWNPSGGGGFEPGSSYSTDAQGGSAVGGTGSDMGLGAMSGSMGGASLGLNMGAPPSIFGAAQPGLDAANPFATAPSVPYNAPPPTAPVTMSPNERDLMIRTAYGEDPNNPAAIAGVINNRYQDATSGQGFSQYGGSLIGQMSAPAQFNGSPTDAKYGAAARALNPNSADYSRIGQAVDGVMSGETPDPTFGATSFYAPSAANPAVVAANPAFAGPSQTIGTQQFYGGVPSMASLTAATHGDPFTKAVQAAISKAAMPSVNGMPGGLGYGDTNSSAFATQPANGGPMRQAELGQGIAPSSQPQAPDAREIAIALGQTPADNNIGADSPVGLRPLASADNQPGAVPQPSVEQAPSSAQNYSYNDTLNRGATAPAYASVDAARTNVGMVSGIQPPSAVAAPGQNYSYNDAVSAPFAGGLAGVTAPPSKPDQFVLGSPSPSASASTSPPPGPLIDASGKPTQAGWDRLAQFDSENVGAPGQTEATTSPPAQVAATPVPITVPASPAPTANTPSFLSRALHAPGDALAAIKAKASELSPAVSLAGLMSGLKNAKPGSYSPTTKGGNPSPVQLASMLQQAPAAPAAPQFQLNPDGSIPISWPLSQVQAYYASLAAPPA